MPLRLGCWTPLQDDESPTNHCTHAIESIHEADQQGFDMVLVAERWVGGFPEAWQLANLLAINTKRIELLVAVHPGILTPQVVSRFGAGLHQLSEGRCALNIVNGARSQDLNIYGNGAWLDEERGRYERMDEFIRVVKGMWGQQPFQFSGAFYNVDTADAQVARTGDSSPRLYSTSSSPVGTAIVARNCDSFFITSTGGHTNYEENIAITAARVKEIRQIAAAAGNPAIQCHLNATVVCFDRDEDALQRADSIEAKSQMANTQLGTRGLGAGLVGAPETIIYRMKRYAKIGIDGFMLRFIPEGKRGKFARRIMPHL